MARLTSQQRCVPSITPKQDLCVCEQEYVVATPKRSQLQPYEKFLKKFKYKKALFAALEVCLLSLL